MNGQSLRVEATGYWSHDGVSRHGPNGAGVPGGLVSGNNRGALVGRVGGGNWFFLGENSTTTISQGGDLYLAMSDDNYGNNAGSITVRYFVLASTLPKVWQGGYAGFETKADFSANWRNGKPFNGDQVIFDDSAYDCDWDLPNISLSLLDMTTNYAHTLRLNNVSGAANRLAVTGAATIRRGALDLGWNNTLSVSGELQVKSSATLWLGYSPYSNASLEVGVLRLTDNAFLRGGAAGDWDRPLIRNAPGVMRWQFLVENATVSLSGYGPGLFNLGTLDLAAAARIESMDRIQFRGDSQDPDPSVRLHASAAVTRTFTGWEFDANVSTNVDGSDVAPGSNITFQLSTGAHMGTPYERDAKGVINWVPDGGATGQISGNLSGGSNYGVWVTTDPQGGLTQLGGAAVVAGSAYSIANLQAPATYYIFAFEGTGAPIGGAARGGYGHAGLWSSDPLFLAAGGDLSGKNIVLQQWAQARGYVQRVTEQVGPVRVAAYWGDPAQPGAVLQAKAMADPVSLAWSLALPPATYYYLTAYVDLNGNGQQDYFEASGSSASVTVSSGEDHDAGIISVAGGSAALGGTVSLLPQVVHSGAIGVNQSAPMLKLTLSVSNLDAIVTGVKVAYAGSGFSATDMVEAYEDADSNGVFSQSQDRWLAGQTFMPGQSTGTLTFMTPLAIAAGAGKSIFLNVRVYNSGTARVVVESTASFALSSGQMEDQKIYPVDSGAALVKQSVPASFDAQRGDMGGYWTNFTVYRGQKLGVTASGTWRSSATAAGSTAAGLPGTEGLDTVLPAARVGELIGRVQGMSASYSSNEGWFRIGASTINHEVQASGQLVLAMNDFVGAYYDNSGEVMVDFAVSGATSAAIAGTVYYSGGESGTLRITANREMGMIPMPERSLDISLVGGTTYYPYLITGLPPAWYNVSAEILSNAQQKGQSGRTQELLVGATNQIDVIVALGSATLSGKILYGGSLWDQYSGSLQNGGQFRIGVTTSSDLERNAAFFGWAAQTSSGDYVIAGLPIPNTFYVIAFGDSNWNNEPDGPEPLGYFGSVSPRRGISDLGLALTPVKIAVSMTSAAVGDIQLFDNGSISGQASIPSGLSGSLVVAAVRDGVVENRRFVDVPNMGAAAGNFSMYYSVGLLRPATNYQLFAFLDANRNNYLDAGEKTYFSSANINVYLGGQAYLDFTLGAGSPPPAVSTFTAASEAGRVVFGWIPSPGASEYELRTSSGGLAAAVTSPATYYIESLADNASSHIRIILPKNANGSGPAAAVPPVYSLAAIPTGLAATVHVTSVTLSWGGTNVLGTRFRVYRSTTAAAFGVVAGETFSTGFADVGLTPGLGYWYRIAAVNGNGLRTDYSAQSPVVMNSLSAAAIAGQVTYLGAQRGAIVVQAFGNSSFVGTASATLTLPNMAVQPYFMQVAGGKSYFVRAFVDYNGDQVRQSSEAAGAFGAPTAISVAGGSVTEIGRAHV
jgi:hypothetical protein